MSSLAARPVNTRVCPLQPNGMLSRGTQTYPGANAVPPLPPAVPDADPERPVRVLPVRPLREELRS